MFCLVRVTSPVMFRVLFDLYLVLCFVKWSLSSVRTSNWFYWTAAIKSIKTLECRWMFFFFFNYYICWHKTDEGRRGLLPTLKENITFIMIQNSVWFCLFFFTVILTILTKRYITDIHRICNTSAFWWWSALTTASDSLVQDDLQELLLRSNVKMYKMKLPLSSRLRGMCYRN